MLLRPMRAVVLPHGALFKKIFPSASSNLASYKIRSVSFAIVDYFPTLKIKLSSLEDPQLLAIEGPHIFDFPESRRKIE